jgi:hypothetical protein
LACCLRRGFEGGRIKVLVWDWRMECKAVSSTSTRHRMWLGLILGVRVSRAVLDQCGFKNDGT